MEKSSDILAGGCRAGNSDGGAENRSLLQTIKLSRSRSFAEDKNAYWADFEYCNGFKKLQNQKEMGGLDEKSSLHVYVLR